MKRWCSHIFPSKVSKKVTKRNVVIETSNQCVQRMVLAGTKKVCVKRATHWWKYTSPAEGRCSCSFIKVVTLISVLTCSTSIVSKGPFTWTEIESETVLCVNDASGGSRISQRRGRQPPRWRRQPIIWSQFSPKLHENERIWTQRGGASLAPP